MFFGLSIPFDSQSKAVLAFGQALHTIDTGSVYEPRKNKDSQY